VVADSTQGQAGLFGSILLPKLMLLTFSFLADDSEGRESWLMWHYAGPIVGGLRLLLLFL